MLYCANTLPKKGTNRVHSKTSTTWCHKTSQTATKRFISLLFAFFSKSLDNKVFEGGSAEQSISRSNVYLSGFFATSTTTLRCVGVGVGVDRRRQNRFACSHSGLTHPGSKTFV